MTTFKPQIKKIESASNALYKKLLDLTTGRGVQEHGLCLVSGEKIIAEVLQKPTPDMFWISTTEEHSLFAQTPRAQIILLPVELFKKLDIVGTHAPLLCYPLPEIKPWTPTAAQGLEVVCGLGDPNNLGALLRSALAFNVSSIILLKESCQPFHPKVIKSSAGACFQIPLYKGPSLQDIASFGPELYALDMEGTPLPEFAFPKNLRVLLGEEGSGVPKNIPLQRISIPMNPKLESLNATVAASLLFYSYSTFKIKK